MKDFAKLSLIIALVLASCSSHVALDDQYQPLGRAVQQGNGFFELKLEEEPQTVVNGANYMDELRRNSPTYYEVLAPYDVEVLLWQTAEDIGFSVVVYDGELIVLYDCSNTLKIEGWYYQDCKNTRGNVVLPPCNGPFEIYQE